MGKDNNVSHNLNIRRLSSVEGNVMMSDLSGFTWQKTVGAGTASTVGSAGKKWIGMF